LISVQLLLTANKKDKAPLLVIHISHLLVELFLGSSLGIAFKGLLQQGPNHREILKFTLLDQWTYHRCRFCLSNPVVIYLSFVSLGVYVFTGERWW